MVPWLSIVLLVLGLIGLVLGGDLLVRGSSRLARIFGVSDLVIGLTVVAFGTSSPELAVTLVDALQGKGEIAFGNIVGSNIANIGMVLGLAALVKPLAIRGEVIAREIPMMLLATVAMLVLSADETLCRQVEVIDRSDGMILLLFFGVFIYYTGAEVLGNPPGDSLVAETSAYTESIAPGKTGGSLVVAIVQSLGGLGLLWLAGQLTVNNAVEIATSIGVPEVVVGLTIVAVGTSLPELVTSIVAVWKGQSDLAVGNIVGSNVYNLLFVLGITSTVNDCPIPEGGWFDLLWMAGLSLMLIPMAFTGQRRIARVEGFILVVGFAVYITWRVLAAMGRL